MGWNADCEHAAGGLETKDITLNLHGDVTEETVKPQVEAAVAAADSIIKSGTVGDGGEHTVSMAGQALGDMLTVSVHVTQRTAAHEGVEAENEPDVSEDEEEANKMQVHDPGSQALAGKGKGR